jgi:hypothetical protein
MTKDDPQTNIVDLPLTAFELPKWLVEPAVRSCRLFNTALDFIFYDVPTLRAALAAPATEPMVWLKLLRSRVAPLATVNALNGENALTAPACSVPALTDVAPV